MSGTPLRIGPRSREWLESVGIRTLEDLEAVGPLEAWRRAKAAHPRQVSLNLLYGLQGLLIGCAWNELPPALRASLRRASEEGRVGSGC